MKYQLKSTKMQGDAAIILEYDDSTSRLLSIELSPALEDNQVIWILNQSTALYSTSSLKAFLNDYTQFRLTKIKIGYTFNDFWSEYGSKQGNKQRAIKLWEAMSEDNRSKAMDYIKGYNSYLAQNPGVCKLLPETYLNQKRWNN